MHDLELSKKFVLLGKTSTNYRIIKVKVQYYLPQTYYASESFTADFQPHTQHWRGSQKTLIIKLADCSAFEFKEPTWVVQQFTVHRILEMEFALFTCQLLAAKFKLKWSAKRKCFVRQLQGPSVDLASILTWVATTHRVCLLIQPHLSCSGKLSDIAVYDYKHPVCF